MNDAGWPNSQAVVLTPHSVSTYSREEEKTHACKKKYRTYSGFR